MKNTNNEKLEHEFDVFYFGLWPSFEGREGMRDKIKAWLIKEFDKALLEQRESMGFMGLLFGAGLYLDTTDTDIRERAEKYLTEKCKFKFKTDAELNAEIASLQLTDDNQEK